jgi:hypothetical protein
MVFMYLRLKDFISPFKMAGMGVDFMKTGRLSLKMEKIKNRKQLHGLIKAVTENNK